MNNSSERPMFGADGWELRNRANRVPFYQRDNDLDLYEPDPEWDEDFSTKTDIKKTFDLGRVIERDSNRTADSLERSKQETVMKSY